MGREADREAARTRILEVARQVFFARGFAEANLDEVASLAGIAKGTIYRYFESKAELYVAVLSDNSGEFLDHMRAVVDETLSPAEQIRAFGRFYLRHYSEHPEYFRIFWALENQRMLGGLPESLMTAVVEVWNEGLSILAEQLERGVKVGAFRPCDPWETANIFWIIANGVIQTEVDPPRRELRRGELEPVFMQSVELLIRGLEAES